MAEGHPRAWDYTPRELAGWMWFEERRMKREMARQLSIIASGSRGEPKDVKKQLKELNKD